MDFRTAVDFVLKQEGGYVFNEKDPGGETKFGISQRSYPTLDIKKLTEAKARMIYKADYWDSVPCQIFPDKLRLLIFDSAVQHGVSKAVSFIQGCLGCKQDGVVGETTLSMLNLADTTKLFNEYVLRRHAYYTAMKHWDSFGKGWSKRLLEVVLNS